MIRLLRTGEVVRPVFDAEPAIEDPNATHPGAPLPCAPQSNPPLAMPEAKTNDKGMWPSDHWDPSRVIAAEPALPASQRAEKLRASATLCASFIGQVFEMPAAKRRVIPRPRPDQPADPAPVVLPEAPKRNRTPDNSSSIHSEESLLPALSTPEFPAEASPPESMPIVEQTSPVKTEAAAGPQAKPEPVAPSKDNCDPFEPLTRPSPRPPSLPPSFAPPMATGRASSLTPRTRPPNKPRPADRRGDAIPHPPSSAGPPNQEDPSLFAYPTSSYHGGGLLEGLTDLQKTHFYTISSARALVHGQPAMIEQTPVDGVAMIEQGDVELSRRVGGVDKVFFRLGPGDAFGVVESLLGMDHALFTATAQGAAKLRCVPGDPVRAYEWGGETRASILLMENYLRLFARLLRLPIERHEESESGLSGGNAELHSLTLFDSFHSEEFNRLMVSSVERGILKYRGVEAGEVLLSPGDSPAGPLLLQSGSVLAARRLEGGDAISTRWDAPQMFGEEEFLQGIPSELQIEAATPCSVAMLDVRKYSRLRRDDPRSALSMMKTLLKISLRMLF